jgi:hypothetical protein
MGIAHAVELLSSKKQALSLIPSTTKKQTKNIECKRYTHTEAYTGGKTDNIQRRNKVNSLKPDAQQNSQGHTTE